MTLLRVRPCCCRVALPGSLAAMAHPLPVGPGVSSGLGSRACYRSIAVVAHQPLRSALWSLRLDSVRVCVCVCFSLHSRWSAHSWPWLPALHASADDLRIVSLLSRFQGLAQSDSRRLFRQAGAPLPTGLHQIGECCGESIHVVQLGGKSWRTRHLVSPPRIGHQSAAMRPHSTASRCAPPAARSASRVRWSAARTGSGTRYRQHARVTASAVSRVHRWPGDTNTGFCGGSPDA